ncbi:MAG: hypothetical protein HDR01_07655 [Lachnospiraceae bacterium]|nr:hypothetical protein [Lachnospiraceae bacterium]
MLNYFVKNKHGVISVMLAIILTGILSFSSILVEIGRYRSVKALFNEMSDNALFSTLSQYDKDLYERFGLLAMEKKTDEDTYKKYLTENMNLSNEDLIQIDKIIQDLSIENFDKIYDLQNLDVLKGQILECGKYRTIEKSLNDITGLEDSLKGLIKEFEKAMPILDLISNISKVGEAFVEMVISEIELIDICQKYQGKKSSYESALQKYNEAVEKRDKYMEDYSSDSDSEDFDENYEENITGKNEAVSLAASNLKTKAEDLKGVLKEYKETIEKFDKAYNLFISSGANAIVSECKQKLNGLSGSEKEQMNEFIGSIETNFKNGTDLAKSLKEEIERLRDEDFISAYDELDEQIKELEKAIQNGEEGNKMESVPGVKGIIFLVISTILTCFDTIVKLKNNTNKTISEFKKFLPVLEMILTERLTYNTKYNNYYSGLFPSQNPSAGNYGFDANDKAVIDTALSRNKNVADQLQYNTGNINPQIDVEWQEINNIFNAIASSASEFMNSAKALSDLWGVIKVLKALGTLVINIIKLASIFIQKGAAAIAKIIYTHFELGVYATSMFPNRTSEDTDKNLLGNPWSTYKKYWASAGINSSVSVDTDNFSYARAEYIYAGNRSEIFNQVAVYNMIFFLRFTSNIIPVLLNEEVMDIVESVIEVPIIGAIIAILIVIVLMFAESLLDMIVLIIARDSVPIVKTKMYLSADGIDDFVKKMKKILNSPSKDDQKKEAKEIFKDAGNKILDEVISWDYEMYLTFFITFLPSDTIVGRCADLIQMEMASMKRKKLGDTPFKLNEMYTCVRVKTKAKYSPILPIPSISGANKSTLDVLHISYASY